MLLSQAQAAPKASLSLLIGAAALTVRAEDARQQVEFPRPMQDDMLANMRDHLVAIETHGSSHMAPFMPEPMRSIGSAMHQAASRFAVSSRDAEVTGALAAAFGASSWVMPQCVACYEAFRVH